MSLSEARLIFSLYDPTAIFPRRDRALGEPMVAYRVFHFFKEWHHAARDDQKVDQ
jgi:hypothetical protein